MTFILADSWLLWVLDLCVGTKLCFPSGSVVLSFATPSVVSSSSLNGFPGTDFYLSDFANDCFYLQSVLYLPGTYVSARLRVFVPYIPGSQGCFSSTPPTPPSILPFLSGMYARGAFSEPVTCSP